MSENNYIDNGLREVVQSVDQMLMPIEKSQSVNWLVLADELDINIRKLGQLLSFTEKESDNRFHDLENSLRKLSTAKELTYRGPDDSFTEADKTEQITDLLSTVSKNLNRYMNA